MIDNWCILHLERRADRYPIALSNAERLGVPREKVKFWIAKDNINFSDVDDVITAAVEDGFTEFKNIKARKSGIGRICQTWNVCRYLRDLTSRNSIEMFIHDGVIIKEVMNSPTLFYPDFQWFSDVVGECARQEVPFKVLVIGDMQPFFKLEPIAPGSLIHRGVGSTANSVRIYSSLGAASILLRILSEVKLNNYRADEVLMKSDKWDPETPCWSEPGMYTLLAQQLCVDMPSDYLGSDSTSGESYQGIFKEIFSQLEEQQ